MLAVRGRSQTLYLLLTLFGITIFLYLRPSEGVIVINPATGEPWDSANATLGFGALYVVSSPDSPRRSHLLQAANVTGLTFTIPKQRAWSETDVSTFRWNNESESQIGVGSVKAWLSHHLVLHAFLDSGAETALIFEDDIDWDIHLRTTQVPQAQRAARRLSGGRNASSAATAARYPWGHPLDWDLLYLGHCGDYWGDVEESIGVGYIHPGDLAVTPHVTYRDATVLPRTDLHPFTASLLTGLGVPEHSRVLHRSKWPLCSFGYAVTRASAKRILHEIAPAEEDITRGIKAYDVALMAACRDAYELRCYTLNPELFHHMEGSSLISAEEESAQKEVFRPPVDAAGAKQVRWRAETANIECGFWSGDFYFEEDGKKMLKLKEQVGRKNRCLKPNRYRSSWWS